MIAELFYQQSLFGTGERNVKHGLLLASKLRPLDSRYQIAIGQYYRANKLYHESLKHYQKALKLSPAKPQIWAGYIHALILVNEKGQILADAIEQATRLGPAERNMYLGLSILALKYWYQLEPVARQKFYRIIKETSTNNPHELQQSIASYRQREVYCRIFSIDIQAKRWCSNKQLPFSEK